MPEISSLITADSVTGTAVKMQEGSMVLTSFRILNLNANQVAFGQIFDAASTASVTVGTTTPSWEVIADSDANTGHVSAGDGLPTNGLRLVWGLVVACTTTIDGSTDATSHVRATVY